MENTIKINVCLYAKTKRYQSTWFSVSLDLSVRKKHSFFVSSFLNAGP
jgi:hypothetical protein